MGTLLHETTKVWVDVANVDFPYWLKDGSFLIFSERTSWKHLYHYSASGRLLHQVTDGRWEARDLYGVDEATGMVYFRLRPRSLSLIVSLHADAVR